MMLRLARGLRVIILTKNKHRQTDSPENNNSITPLRKRCALCTSSKNFFTRKQRRILLSTRSTCIVERDLKRWRRQSVSLSPICIRQRAPLLVVMSERGALVATRNSAIAEGPCTWHAVRVIRRTSSGADQNNWNSNSWIGDARKIFCNTHWAYVFNL